MISTQQSYANREFCSSRCVSSNPVHFRALSSRSSVEEEEDVTEETAEGYKPSHHLPSVKVTKLPKDQTRYHLSGLLEGHGLRAKFSHIKIVMGGAVDLNHAFVVCHSRSDASEVAKFLNGRLIGRQNVTARVLGMEGLNANECCTPHTCIVHLLH